MIYFIIVNYNSSNLIAQLIQSIEANRNVKYEIVIVNNSPEDRGIYDLKTDNIIVLESGDNLGFGRGCNLGLNWVYAKEPDAIVWLINPDTYLQENTLEKVPAFLAAHSELSILGTVIYTPTGDVWFAGGEFIPKTGAILSKTVYDNTGNEGYLKTDWVSGCSLLINLINFQDCPQFNPEYFLYYEDFDFCLRSSKQGHLIGITNQINIVHHPSSITQKNLQLKFKSSTYSYLLTLQKYSNLFSLLLRLIKLILHAVILIPFKPQVAFGKLQGVWLYLRRSPKSC